MKKNIINITIITLFTVCSFIGMLKTISANNNQTMPIIIKEDDWESLDITTQKIRQDMPIQGSLLYKDQTVLDQWIEAINKQSYKYTNVIAKPIDKYPSEYKTAISECNNNKETDVLLILNNNCATNLEDAQILLQEAIKKRDNGDILNSSLSLTGSIQSMGQVKGAPLSKIDWVLIILGPLSLILMIYYFFQKIKF